MNNEKQHCPKCGSPEAWPPIDGHHNYECNSFLTKEGLFGQDSRCAWLAKITVPLHERIARLEALESSRIVEVDAISARLIETRKERDQLRAQLHQATKERDEARESNDANWDACKKAEEQRDEAYAQAFRIQREKVAIRAQLDRAMILAERYYLGEFRAEPLEEMILEIAKEREGK